MQIAIEISEDDYKRIVKEGITVLGSDADIALLERALENGTVLPKWHGRLIDADAFIDGLRDASKKQRYNECLIDEFLTVDDVFQAVIESLENKGLAEGDAPTIIEADKEVDE